MLRHVRSLLPNQPLLYFADQAHIPYGPRPAAEVRRFSQAISRYLLAQGAGLIVVACNRATAAAIELLRETFPQTPVVGMEPALKPAAAATRSGRIGVLATAGTLRSDRYASLLARFGRGLEVIQDACPGLVEQIEAGRLEGSETERILAAAIRPMLAAGADTLVLACTHYPFVLPAIRRLAGPELEVIDSAPAVARQAARLLAAQPQGAATAGPAGVRAVTSGDPARLAAQIERLLGWQVATGRAELPGG